MPSQSHAKTWSVPLGMPSSSDHRTKSGGVRRQRAGARPRARDRRRPFDDLRAHRLQRAPSPCRDPTRREARLLAHSGSGPRVFQAAELVPPAGQTRRRAISGQLRTACSACSSRWRRDLGVALAGAAEREAPLVAVEQLGHQLGAGSVPVAAGPVDVQPRHRRPPRSRSARRGAGSRGRRRPAWCWRPSGPCRRGGRRRRDRSTRSRIRSISAGSPRSGTRSASRSQRVGHPGQAVDARPALARRTRRRGSPRCSAAIRIGQVSRPSTCRTPAPDGWRRSGASVGGRSAACRAPRPGTQAPWKPPTSTAHRVHRAGGGQDVAAAGCPAAASTTPACSTAPLMREQRGAGVLGGAGLAEPRHAVPGDQRQLRQGLRVEHQRRTAVDAPRGHPDQGVARGGPGGRRAG